MIINKTTCGSVSADHDPNAGSGHANAIITINDVPNDLFCYEIFPYSDFPLKAGLVLSKVSKKWRDLLMSEWLKLEDTRQTVLNNRYNVHLEINNRVVFSSNNVDDQVVRAWLHKRYPLLSKLFLDCHLDRFSVLAVALISLEFVLCWSDITDKLFQECMNVDWNKSKTEILPPFSSKDCAREHCYRHHVLECFVASFRALAEIFCDDSACRLDYARSWANILGIPDVMSGNNFYFSGNEQVDLYSRFQLESNSRHCVYDGFIALLTGKMQTDQSDNSIEKTTKTASFDAQSCQNNLAGYVSFHARREQILKSIEFRRGPASREADRAYLHYHVQRASGTLLKPDRARASGLNHGRYCFMVPFLNECERVGRKVSYPTRAGRKVSYPNINARTYAFCLNDQVTQESLNLVEKDQEHRIAQRDNQPWQPFLGSQSEQWLGRHVSWWVPGLPAFTQLTVMTADALQLFTFNNAPVEERRKLWQLITHPSVLNIFLSNSNGWRRNGMERRMSSDSINVSFFAPYRTYNRSVLIRQQVPKACMPYANNEQAQIFLLVLSHIVILATLFSFNRWFDSRRFNCYKNQMFRVVKKKLRPSRSRLDGPLAQLDSTHQSADREHRDSAKCNGQGAVMCPVMLFLLISAVVAIKEFTVSPDSSMNNEFERAAPNYDINTSLCILQ